MCGVCVQLAIMTGLLIAMLMVTLILPTSLRVRRVMSNLAVPLFCFACCESLAFVRGVTVVADWQREAPHVFPIHASAGGGDFPPILTVPTDLRRAKGAA